ncbi:hypothetical protein L0128_07915 [candidate division KSB1 bacterium]|nr:hypothetical protein [candidate division KSB1 bacterium]
MKKREIFWLWLLLWPGLLLAQSSMQVLERKVISPAKQQLLAPKWAPDGTQIAAAAKQFRAIWIYHLQKNQWRELVAENGAGWDFDWSPDSKKIAFRANKLINRRQHAAIKYVIVSSGQVTTITQYERELSTPRWISESLLGYVQKSELRRYSITQLRLTTGSPHSNLRPVLLLGTTGIYSNRQLPALTALTPMKDRLFNLSLAPDGQTLLFEESGGKIYLQGVDQTQAQFLTTGEMPAWSANGQWIAFATPKDDGHQILTSDIWIISKQGGKPMPITQTDTAIEMRPHWAPNGSMLVCDSDGKIVLLKLKME